MAAPTLPFAALVLCLFCVDCWAASVSTSSPGSETTPTTRTTLAPSTAPAAPHVPWLSVAVNPRKMSALVSDHFLSLTMDPMELSEHRKMGPGPVRALAMAKGLAPAYLRLAGPSSDTLSFTREDGTSRSGAATESDLEAVGRWARDAGWQLVLGLNALTRTKDGGVWDSQKAVEMLGQAEKHGYPLTLQLGSETSALGRAGLRGAVLGTDLALARELLAGFPRYRSAVLLGPDVEASLSAPRANRDALHFLHDEARVAAPSPDAVVWQPWSSAGLSEGKDPANEPDLQREDVNRLLGRGAARRPLWIAESDNAAPTTFGGALQWARRVQVAERVGADVLFRRWHSPGEDHQPTPDFWVSLLHKRLCGRVVLDARLAGNKSAVSTTARCTAAPLTPEAGSAGPNARFTGSFTQLSYERGDVTMFAVNANPTEAKLAVKFSPAAGLHQAAVHEYVLTAQGADLDSRSTLLNGQLLGVDNGGGLPGLTPRVRRSGQGETTLVLPANSVAFFVFPGVQSRACQVAPSSAAEERAAKVPLHLNPTAHDVRVQFHVEGLSKSKTKDKLASTMKINKDPKAANRPQNVLHARDAMPLGWAPSSSLEQYADLDGATQQRSKRATSPPLHFPRTAPVATPEFMDRLNKAHAQVHAQVHAHAQAQASKRKHALSLPAMQAAAPSEVDELEDKPSTIPVAHMYRPDEMEQTPVKPRNKMVLKPLRLPKRLPSPPRYGALPKRTAHGPAPVTRPKPLPHGTAVATLVDPEKGVSAEESSVEEVVEDHFPTGDIMVEVEDSDEAEDSSNSRADGEHDYLDDDDDADDENGAEEAKVENGGAKEVSAHSAAEANAFDDTNVNEQNPYYFAPGEFQSSLQQQQQQGDMVKVPTAAGGEIGEVDLVAEPMVVVEQTTPPPYEPHLEEFVVMQTPMHSPEQEQLARERAELDLESFYQGAAPSRHDSAAQSEEQYADSPRHEGVAQSEGQYAQDSQHQLAAPPSEDDEDINTDLLIELGKRYLREKKMTLNHPPQLEETDCEKGHRHPSGPSEEMDMSMDMHMPQGARRRRQAPATRRTLPTAASPRPRPRTAVSRTPSEESSRRQTTSSREIRRELEQRLTERRERLERPREPAVMPVPRPRENSRPRDSTREASDRLAKAREQIEQQREQREREREQQREERERRGRELARAASTPALRRTERVKRSDSDVASKYLDSFGRQETVHHHSWRKQVTPSAQHHGQHHTQHHGLYHHLHHHNVHPDGATPSAAAAGRYKYGHSPQRVRQNVRHEVVKKTDVVRLVPEDEGEDEDEEVKEGVGSAEVNYLPAARGGARRHQQVYKPNDNFAALWEGSPLSPLRLQHHRQGSALGHSHSHASAAKNHGYDEAPEADTVPEASVLPAEEEDSEASLEQLEEDEVPTEVKTTRIVKTERTYQTTERGGWDRSEESGYGSDESFVSTGLEADSARFASLEHEDRGQSHHQHPHHHQNHHQHASQKEEGAAAKPGRASEENSEEYITDAPYTQESESSQEVEVRPISGVAVEQDAVPSSAVEESEAQAASEDGAGPKPPQTKEQQPEEDDEDDETLPEFPFQTPPGPKEQVVGYKHDEHSPGGWYTYASPATPQHTVPQHTVPKPQAQQQQQAAQQNSEEYEHAALPSIQHGASSSYSGSGRLAHLQHREQRVEATAQTAPPPRGHLAPGPAPQHHVHNVHAASSGWTASQPHAEHAAHPGRQPATPQAQGVQSAATSAVLHSQLHREAAKLDVISPGSHPVLRPQQQRSEVRQTGGWVPPTLRAPGLESAGMYSVRRPAPQPQAPRIETAPTYTPSQLPPQPQAPRVETAQTYTPSQLPPQTQAPRVQMAQTYIPSQNVAQPEALEYEETYPGSQPAPQPQAPSQESAKAYAPSQPAQQPQATRVEVAIPVQQPQAPEVEEEYEETYPDSQPAPQPQAPRAQAAKTYTPGQPQAPRVEFVKTYASGQPAPQPQASEVEYEESYPASQPEQQQQAPRVEGAKSYAASQSIPQPQVPEVEYQESYPVGKAVQQQAPGVNVARNYPASQAAPLPQAQRVAASWTAPQSQTPAWAVQSLPGPTPAGPEHGMWMQSPTPMAIPAVDNAPYQYAPAEFGQPSQVAGFLVPMAPPPRAVQQPASQPASGRRTVSQQPNAPAALSYLAKYFQPVVEQRPKFAPVSNRRTQAKTRPSTPQVWQESAPVDDLWRQPAPADDLWKQPAPADDLWKQPTPADDLWKQPAPADDLWKKPTPSDDFWRQPTDDLWKQSSSSDDLWGQPAPADSLWPSAPSVSRQRPAASRNTHEASLAPNSGEQLLDYNTHILRRKQGDEAPKAPPVQIASLAPAGAEEVPMKQPPVKQPPAHVQRQRRWRRALPEHSPASAAHNEQLRPKRGLFDKPASRRQGGSQRDQDDLSDEDWSAETERMRRKKQARQRAEGQHQDGQHIQILGDNSFLTGLVSTMLSKVLAVIGYLGRVTQTKHV